MRREERVTVQGPVKEQQPDGMSHRGGRSEHVCRLLRQSACSKPQLCDMILLLVTPRPPMSRRAGWVWNLTAARPPSPDAGGCNPVALGKCPC